MPFQIIKGDITQIKTDAIVNTANPAPTYGRGTDAAIYSAAGEERLLKARKKIGRLAVGEVAVTRAYGLPAKKILHTVGPAWKGGNHGEQEMLASCYRKCLLMAEQLGLSGIAFPLISAGSYRFPKETALKVALSEIRKFLQDSEMDVTLVIYDRRAYELSKELAEDVRTYIRSSRGAAEPQGDGRAEKNEAALQMREEGSLPYTGGGLPAAQEEIPGQRTEELPDLSETYSADFFGIGQAEDAAEDRQQNAPAGFFQTEKESFEAAPAQSASPPPKGASRTSEKKPRVFQKSYYPKAAAAAPAPSPKPSGRKEHRKQSIPNLKEQVGESFRDRLFRLIDERGLTDAEVYKKANLDRRLFSKIRSSSAYLPKKQTALALAMALQLNLEETTDLVGRAGIALSDASLFDLIIRYCIEQRIYDLFTVNAILFEYDQLLLGH